MMTEIKSVKGEEGTELVLLSGPRGFYVEIRDTDADRVLWVTICPTLEMAEKKFEEAK